MCRSSRYYLGRRAGLREREEDQRADRIERVVSRYVETANSGRDSGPHALIRAGIRELNDDGECRTALAMIAGRLGRHPRGGMAEHLTRADRKGFFEAPRMDSLAVLNYNDVVERFRDRQ